MIDNREVTVTIHADGLRALVNAMSLALTGHSLDKPQARRVEELRLYFEARLAELPELATEKQPKLI